MSCGIHLMENIDAPQYLHIMFCETVLIINDVWRQTQETSVVFKPLIARWQCCYLHHTCMSHTSPCCQGNPTHFICLLQMFLSSNCRLQNPPSPPLHETESRPSWAARSYDHQVTKETARSMLTGTRWNAGVRPGPVRSAVPRLSLQALSASQRSQRSAPSKYWQLLLSSGLNVM